MAESMRAVVITEFGGPEVLRVQEVERPEPGPHEILVRVRASGLNRADLLQRVGRYPAPPDSRVLGDGGVRGARRHPVEYRGPGHGDSRGWGLRRVRRSP